MSMSTSISNISIYLEILFSAIQQAGGTPYVIGGAVRDSLLGDAKLKDVDIEVHNLEEEVLLEILQSLEGSVDLVGKSFGVYKMWHPPFHNEYPWAEALDISVPRTEKKVGVGHTSFEIQPDPYIGLEKACLRRDFTFNTIAYHPTHGYVDPYGGKEDLGNKVLKHTSPAFAEDPLRVLRGMQFAGRFDLDAHPSTVDLCASLKGEYETLSKERVWGEWWKWATKSVVPSKGLHFLRETGWLEFYPELKALIGIPQDSEWHPEGDVWVHTGLVCDAAAQIAIREGLSTQDRGILVMAALCHDLAKATHTEFIEGRWRSRGHEQAGLEPTVEFFRSIGYIIPKKGYGDILEAVIPLVTNHLAHCSLGANPSPKAVRRLSTKVNIEMLALMVEADHSGRPPLPKGMPPGMAHILGMSREMKVSQGKPEPIINGKLLIQAGVKPGKEMGALIQKAYEAQLDGEFKTEEEGLRWLNL